VIAPSLLEDQGGLGLHGDAHRNALSYHLRRIAAMFGQRRKSATARPPAAQNNTAKPRQNGHAWFLSSFRRSSNTSGCVAKKLLHRVLQMVLQGMTRTGK
jgi:hypothetical protein